MATTLSMVVCDGLRVVLGHLGDSRAYHVRGDVLGQVSDERIAEVLHLVDPHAAAAVLTHSALTAGGRDNITAIVLDVVDGPPLVGDGRLLGAVLDVANVVDPGAFHLL